jgi:YtxH-like protein
MSNMFRNVVSMGADDLLCALGLERRRRAMDHLFTATTYFIAGAIVGSCAALLLAPTSGRALRNRLSEQLRSAGERARRAANGVRERVSRPSSGNYDDAGSTAS